MQCFGDQRIDADHDLIILRFDELAGLIQTGAADQYSRPELVEQLFEYLTTHFSREERLMVDVGFPELETHREAHRQMQEEFYGLMSAMLESGPDLRLDVSEIREVFLAHIVTHDEIFAEWLQRQRASRTLPQLLDSSGL
jgi:hemerythrin